MSISASQLAGRLIPAVPVPFDRDGRLHEVGLRRYVEWMAGQPIGGVAVCGTRGEDYFSARGMARSVLSAWRLALTAGTVLIAATAPGPIGKRQSRSSPMFVGWHDRAADLGANALLVHPPTAFRERPDRHALILDYHSVAAEAGLPLIAFYLYEIAGGISYPPELLAQLLARGEVLGVKIATLDSVMTFQDIAPPRRGRRASKLAITGEDRFLGYSLMCGARGP